MNCPISVIFEIYAPAIVAEIHGESGLFVDAKLNLGACSTGRDDFANTRGFHIDLAGVQSESQLPRIGPS
jgi:hypothetical protein